MKIHSVTFKKVLVFGAAAILAIFVAGPAFSQETAPKESHKKITLKIVSDDNGKTTMIDTTMEMSDTAMMDSVRNEIEKVIMIGKGGKCPYVKFRNMAQGFAYDFDVPSPPDCLMDLEELEGLAFEGMASRREMEDFTWDRMAPGPERRVIRSGGKGQSLSDILGDIPMDRVVSYSIKDRKNGKRIIIDLNDAPMFERQDRVIVIREPKRMQRNRNHPGRQVKVYMNSDDDAQIDNTPEPPAAPTPPPPPPPAPKSK